MKNLLPEEAVSRTLIHKVKVTQRTSHSCFCWRNTGASGQGSAQTSRNCSLFFSRSQDTSHCDWKWLCWTQNSIPSQHWHHWRRAMKDEVIALPDNKTWNLVRPTTDTDVIPGEWVYKGKLGSSAQVNTKHAVRQNASNKWKDSDTLRHLRLPGSQRLSGFHFHYQRRRAIWFNILMSRRFSCTHQKS